MVESWDGDAQCGDVRGSGSENILRYGLGKIRAPVREWPRCHVRARRAQSGSHNFKKFIEGRRWYPWAVSGSKETHVFAGPRPCNGEEIHRASPRFYALEAG